MTVQINDTLFYKKIQFAIVDRNGPNLFDPAALGFKSVRICSACGRCFVADYIIVDETLFLNRIWCVGLPDELIKDAHMGNGPKLFGITGKLDSNPKLIGYVYDNLHAPMLYTGSLTLAYDVIRKFEMKTTFGFRPFWIYERVREIAFEAGRIVKEFDRSSEAAEMRVKMIEKDKDDFLSPYHERKKAWWQFW